MCLKLEGKLKNIMIILVYMPTCEHPEKEMNEKYDQIEECIKKVTYKDMLIVLRD